MLGQASRTGFLISKTKRKPWMFMTACGAWSFERHLMASGRDSQEQSQHPGDDSVERQMYLFP